MPASAHRGNFLELVANAGEYIELPGKAMHAGDDDYQVTIMTFWVRIDPY